MSELAPWEKKTPEQAPWERTPSAAPQVAPLEIEEKMHDDVSWQDRMLIKNLSSSPEAGVGYLQNKYPKLEVQGRDGRILMKNKSAKKWNVLDPKTGFFSTDFLQDTSDIAYDALAGIGEGAAVAAAGIAGGAATGGAGAIPAAMGAGAVAGGITEAARQKLGEALGLKQQLDLGQVGLSAGIGAVSPLLMGTGAGAKQVAKAQLKGQVTELGAQKLLASQSGVIKKAYLHGVNKVAPNLAEKLSGIPRDLFGRYARRLDKMDVIDQDPRLYTGEAVFNAWNTNENKRKLAEEGLKDHILGADIELDVGNIKQKMLDQISSLESKPRLYAIDEKKIANLKRIYSTAFGVGERGPVGPNGFVIPSNKVSPDDYFSLKKSLEDLRSNIWVDSSDKNFRDKTFDSAAGNLLTELRQMLGDKVPATNDVMKEYNKYYDNRKIFKKYLLNDKKVIPAKEQAEAFTKKAYDKMSTMNPFTNDNTYRELSKLDSNLGTNLTDVARDLKAHKLLHRPSLMPVSSGGTTSTSRTGLASLIGGTLGYQVGKKVGAPGVGAFIGSTGAGFLGSPAAMRGAAKASIATQKAAQEAGKRLPMKPTALQGQMTWQGLMNIINSNQGQQ